MGNGGVRDLAANRRPDRASMGARGGSRSWVALLATTLMFAPLHAIAGDPRPLTAHAGAELVVAEWCPPPAVATIELSHINPLREGR